MNDKLRNTSQIRSIGWLNMSNGKIKLTPVFEGEVTPRSIVISQDEFQTVQGDDELMKQKAIDKLKDMQSAQKHF